MSYILAPVIDTSSFVSNPLTADLEAGGNNITGAGTVSASVGDMSTVSFATQLSTNAGSLLGFNWNRISVFHSISWGLGSYKRTEYVVEGGYGSSTLNRRH